MGMFEIDHLTKDELSILKETIRSATFRGQHAKQVSALLDKLDGAHEVEKEDESPKEE